MAWRATYDTEAIDLLQLHCPPTEAFYLPEVFDGREALVQAGKLRHDGVSVEKVEEAIKAMDFPGAQSVQIIYNLFRQRAAEVFLPLAQARQVGVLARLPLSSGMLTGKLSATSTFAADDHRHFNREGAGFDKGETFSGLPYEAGLAAVELIRPLLPAGMSMAQLALRWILMNPAVTCTIPGGKRAEQVIDNVAAANLPELSAALMAALEQVSASGVKASRGLYRNRPSQTRRETGGHCQNRCTSDLTPPSPQESAQTYVALLFGEAQLQQALGNLPPFDEAEIARRSQRAFELTCRLYGRPAGCLPSIKNH